jgi:hypothetical protein
MKILCVVLLVACACPSKQTAGPATGSGSGSSTTPTPPPVTATTCDGVKAHVEGLYRAEAQQKDPKRVDDYTADNTQMVMNDCNKNPSKVVPCLASAASVVDLEKQCLVPLDDEGTEGDKK